MAAARSDSRRRRLVSLTSLALVLSLLAAVSCFDTVCRYSTRGACYEDRWDMGSW